MYRFIQQGLKEAGLETGWVMEASDLDDKTFAFPSFLFVPLSSRGVFDKGNRRVIKTTNTFGIVSCLRVVDDPRGSKVAEKLDEMRKQVTKAVTVAASNIRVGNQLQPYLFIRGRLLDLLPSALFWLDEFEVETWL